MKNDEKMLQILEYLREKGLKKTTCLSLALIILMTSSFAMESGKTRSNTKETYSGQEFIKIQNTKEEKLAIEIPKEVSNEEKINVILNREGITREQFDEIVATVVGEAAPGSYEDAYAVINTFYNRTISKTWINEMIRATGEDKGRNLYEQITLINQSEVYTSGRYKEFLGTNDGPVYQAVIDFLYTLDRKHDYLCFFASYGDIPDSVQFVPGGNWYYSLMLSEDKVQELTLVREKDWS